MTPMTTANPTSLLPTFGTRSPKPPTSGPSFQDLLMQSIQSASQTDMKAQSTVAQSLAGEDVKMIDSVVALREADLSLRLMIQVRNKLLDAYNEIKQMQF